MTYTSLSSIFNETKDELASSLTGLALPKDAQEVQIRITTYLNKVCDEDNEFRQNLTQSEDYILQAALSMLNAQRDMVTALTPSPKIETSVRTNESSITATSESTRKPFVSTPVPTANALLGGGGGALIGKLVLGGWGAVFGAIAGTALVLYLAQQKQSESASLIRQLKKPTLPTVEAKVVETPVNPEVLINVVAQLCESLDNLIETFRAQIKRVINKYESQEKPSIERDYRTLIEGIQSLLGYKRGHNVNEEKYVSKLQERIEDLAELLDNYNLEAVDYTEDTSSWFDSVESDKATEIKLVAPAIVKDGVLVIKGKVFIPKN